mmetsp:Transcript_39270/g.76822  ORF Transcript_39270/g.76822 Transcript_39270/m.76822 type:complete len:86 (-) Transcript_39270:193-450(-)
MVGELHVVRESERWADCVEGPLDGERATRLFFSQWHLWRLDACTFDSWSAGVGSETFRFHAACMYTCTLSQQARGAPAGILCMRK